MRASSPHNTKISGKRRINEVRARSARPKPPLVRCILLFDGDILAKQVPPQDPREYRSQQEHEEGWPYELPPLQGATRQTEEFIGNETG